MQDNDTELSDDEKAAHVLPVGTIIDGKYRVVDHIGSGGMGEVYKVESTEVTGFYALKVLAPQLASQKLMARRLENEAKAARTLAHGNIVSVYDVGEDSHGAPYLVMDFIEGEGLDQILKREQHFTQERAIHLFIQIAEALVHARQKSILHRDLKPSNILLTKTESGTELIKIVDFGIAKIDDKHSVDKTQLTQTGELLGTPLYMSPEQCRGEELDGRSDIYSFGCIMYEMLVGKPAFEAENQVLVILKHQSDIRPVLPASLGISRTMRDLIARCLEKDPENRYPDAVSLQIDLERILNGKPLQPYISKKNRAKKREGVLAYALLSCLILAIGWSFISPLLNPPVMPGPLAVVAPTVPKPPRPETYEGKTLAQWTDLIEKKPDNAQLYFNRAQLHSDRDERTNAIDDYTQAIKITPDYLQAYCERSIQYTLLAQYDKAEKDADKAISLDPEALKAWEAKCWVSDAREIYDESLKVSAKMISMNDYAYYHYLRASVLQKVGRFSEAAIEIEKAMSEDGSAFMEALAGLIEIDRQNFPKALDYLKEASAEDDARSVEWCLLAYYWVCKGDLKKAEEAVQHAKAVETFPARSYRLAGEVYRTAGRFEDAIQQFSSATSLEEYPPGYRERAQCYIALGQWRSAYEDLKKSLALNSRSILTLSYAALVENQLGMKDKADEHITAAFKGNAIPAAVYVNRASIKIARGDFPAANSDIEVALKVDPFLKEAHEAKAKLFELQNDKAAAEKEYKLVEKLVSRFDL